MWKVLLAGAAYTVGTYILDVLIFPHIIFNRLRKEEMKTGKPILNVGAGLPQSSLRAQILGPTLWGDINTDIAASREAPCPKNSVCYADAHHLPYPDKYFSAAFAAHVIEHVTNPVQAIHELNRVADRVYLYQPAWWAPHTWLYTDHKWYITRETAYPLWQRSKDSLTLPGVHNMY